MFKLNPTENYSNFWLCLELCTSIFFSLQEVLARDPDSGVLSCFIQLSKLTMRLISSNSDESDERQRNIRVHNNAHRK
jgi:hypothetical protein